MIKLLLLLIAVIGAGLYFMVWLFNHGHLLMLSGIAIITLFALATVADRVLKKMKNKQ